MAKKGHFLLGFVIGSAAALSAALLLAPTSGEELKQNASKKINQLKRRAQDYNGYATDASEDLKDVARDTFGNVIGQAKDFSNLMKEKLQNVKGADFNATTEALKNQLKQAKAEIDLDLSADTAVDNRDFDDIVIDGQSAFALAKDDADEISTTKEPVKKVTSATKEAVKKVGKETKKATKTAAKDVKKSTKK